MTADSGQETVDEFQLRLGQLGEVGARLMLTRTDGTLTLYSAVVEASPDAAIQAEFSYDYGDFVFVGGVVPGASLAGWVQENEGVLAGVTFVVPGMSNASWRRYPSRTSRRGVTMKWPRTDHQAYVSNRPDLGYQSGVLAGSDVPFFPTVAHAISALLFDSWPDTARATAPPLELITTYAADTSAWIQGVRILPAAVYVDVAGEDLREVRLQVTSGPQRYDEAVERPREIRIPIAYSSANDLWIALTADKRWLDYREVRYQWQALSHESDVTFQSDNLSQQVDRIRLGGETEVVEFKEQVSPKDESLAKTVAAFANGAGGTMLIGVRDKTGELAGIKDALPGMKDRVQNIIRNNLNPVPPYAVYECQVDHRDLLVVRVEPGADWPYGVGQVNPDFYVRRGATTWRAQPEDIRAVVNARLQVQQGNRPWFWPPQ